LRESVGVTLVPDSGCTEVPDNFLSAVGAKKFGLEDVHVHG
jgi:hypothetical protein